MGVCKTLIILADLLLMYCLVYTASQIPARGSLQNPYHTCRFAPYVLFGVHGVANLRRSIRVYQTLRIHI